MSPRYTTVGGYLNTDPYYVSPEEEAAMYDGPPDWDEGEEPIEDAKAPNYAKCPPRCMRQRSIPGFMYCTRCPDRPAALPLADGSGA